MCPHLGLLLTWLVLAAAVEIKKIPVRGVTAVVGGVAELPCEVSHPPHDAIILLLWFKDGLTTPIYRYDSRRQGQAEHRSDAGALGTRISLDVTVDPAILRVASLTLKDEALYFCRVDFRLQPTKTTRVSLTVVVPPTGVSVFVGGSSQAVSSMVGPYLEGAMVELTCVAQGGKPRPAVVWYKATQLLDDIMESETAVDNTTLMYSSTTATTLTQGPQTPASTSEEAATTLTPGPSTTRTTTTTTTVFSTKTMSESFNTLRLGPLTRHDLKLLLTCEASNYNKTLPTSTVVMVDMNLPPLSVAISSPPPFLKAGQEYQVKCEVRGARPPPTITWWQGSLQVLRAVLETHSKNSLDYHLPRKDQSMPEYSSMLLNTINTSGDYANRPKPAKTATCTPRPEDDGKVLKCVAESYVTNTVLHDSWIINVHYRPTATARFGSSLDIANIKEGDDVYFECDVYANPKATRVSWRLNNQVLTHNVSAGVIVSNQALVLQRVVRAWAGVYSCHALNPVGDGVSNTLRLDVKYAPVCSPGQVTTYAVGRYEDAEVTCSVDANPALTKFQWTFNNTADIIDVPQGRFSSDNTASVITYTPMTSLDYGTLLCWADNPIGTQRVPCVFHIVPAGKPDPPSNCSVGVAGGGRTSVRVVCSSESGSSTSFLLQARVVGGSHALNVSSSTPVFMVDGLLPGRKYDLFITAHNDKGVSTPAHLTIAAHGSVYQHHDGPSEAEVRDGGKTVGGEEGVPGYPYLHALSLPTLLPAALGVGAGLVIIIIILILLITFRTRRPRQRPEEAHLRSPSDHSLASDQKSLSGHRSPALPTPTSQEGLRSPRDGRPPSAMTQSETGGGPCHDRDKQVETESDKEPDVIPLQEPPFSAPALLPATVLPPICYHYPTLDAHPARMTSPRYGRMGVVGSGGPDDPRGSPRDPLRTPQHHQAHQQHRLHHLCQLDKRPPLPQDTQHTHQLSSSLPRGGPLPPPATPPAPVCRHPNTLDPHRLPFPGVEGPRLPPASEGEKGATRRLMFSMESSLSVCEDDAPSTPLLRKRESSV
ncbi:uncharacterized protein LOC122254330 [Penaeus japonicus]|uniref:uncharacterized protein LOC122254330 n=1 Tax=Penaeus japonicus TaxID=27405 RepID=UPI001C713500|nr:uncharacterized protein LOC122254330 [Penaeus japonicus]